MLPKARLFATVLRVGVAATGVVATVVGVGLLAACGKDGSAPYAGWTTLTDGEGVYRLRYLAPPWERVPAVEGDASISLVVPPVYGSLDAGVPPKYALTAALVSGAPLLVLQAEVARRSDASVLMSPAPYTTMSGDEGFHAVLEDAAHLLYFHFVALPVPGERTLLVRFEMNEDPRPDREANAMLRAIDVQPFVD